MIKKFPKSKIPELFDLLHKDHEAPVTELENWTNPIQFMVAVILSAQATDVGVNKVTPALFEKYVTVEDFANADLENLLVLVKSINYYKTKAQRIIDANKFIIKEYNGVLPPDILKLVEIPGIGRKSANVILHEALDAETQGIVVDTHVTRVSYRLGLTPYQDAKDAVKVEDKLMKIIPKEEWKFYSNAAVLHGRYICKARKPKCQDCSLNKLCPSSFNTD